MRHHSAFFPILFLAFFSTLHCPAQSKKADSQEAMAKFISESNQIYFQAFVKDNPSLLVNNYTEDCWLLTTGPSLCGPSAALDFYKAAYRKGVRNGKLIINELYTNGDQFVTEEGFYQFFNDDNLVLENGIYITIWKKTSAGWIRLRSSFHNHN